MSLIDSVYSISYLEGEHRGRPVSRALSSGLEGPDSRPPCTLMVLSACKIRRGCNVLQILIQNYISGGTKVGELSLPDQNCNGMSPDHP